MGRARSHGVVVGVIIALLVGLAVPAALSAATIRIGAILPLSGNSEADGLAAREGIQLAVDEVNARGGIEGRKLEMVYEDSRSDPQAGVAAFDRLETARPPLFYISMLSSVSIALAPRADERKVVLIGLVSSTLALTSGHDWVYRYWNLAREDIPGLLRILQDLKVKKLGIIFLNGEYGIEEQRLLARGFTDIGGKVVSRSFEMKDKEFGPQIAAMKDQEAIFVAAIGTSLTEVILKLRETGFRGHILMPNTGANPSLWSLPELQGVYLTAHAIYNPGYLFAREAGELYSARYKKPLIHTAGAGYDFIRLITGLLEGRKATRQTVKDVLAGGFQYSGVFGSVSLRAGEHDMSFPVYPARIVDGKIKYR